MVVMNEFRKAPESDRSEEPKFSGSGRLQINADFLLRDDHFGALLTAGKPEADLATFRTLPEPTRSRWCPNQAVGSETIAIPYSNQHGDLRWRSNHCNSLLFRTVTPSTAAKAL